LFVRLLVVVSAITLVNWGLGFCLEPAPVRTTISEIVTKTSNGQALIVSPKAPAAIAEKQKPQPTPVVARPSQSSRPAPPTLQLTNSGKNRAALAPAPQPKPAAINSLKPANARVPVVRAVTKADLIPESQPMKAEPSTRPALSAPKALAAGQRPPVKAKALYCLDLSSERPMLAENVSEPLPIASITKLLTAMTVIDDMNLDNVLEVPNDIKEVERHTVGIRPGDLLTVRDLLHGMLIESGNDCAEVLARSYPKGGRIAFIAAMNRRATRLGASQTNIYTPSGLDMKFMLGRKDQRTLVTRKPNLATAEEVAIIAREAFKYPLIREISSMKTYTMRTRNQPPRNYALVANDKLLHKDLPLAGAKTGFTNMAGKCIVAQFTNEKSDYLVVVLNTPHHFKAAEKIYRWVCKTF